MADVPTLTRASIVEGLGLTGDCTGCVALQALLLLGDAARSLTQDLPPSTCADLVRILDAMDWTAAK